ncbi:Transportin-1 [Galdieria sulphuraria]|nr:Transportin-1 [Galdieria sulphuraria]
MMAQDATETRRKLIYNVLKQHGQISQHWEPVATGLKVLITMLRQSLFSSTQIQEEVYKSLKELSEHPDFTKYLAYFVANGKSPNVVALAASIEDFGVPSEQELTITRQQAALLLKNNIKQAWERKLISDDDLQYIKQQIILCLGEEVSVLQNAAAIGIAACVSDSLGGVASWPQVLDIFLSLLNCEDQVIQEGVLDALSIICEDNADKLCRLPNDPLSIYIPKLISYFRHPNARFRYFAMQCTSPFILLLPRALHSNMEAYLNALFSVAHDESSAVRKRFCSVICTLLESCRDALVPHMDTIIEYMLVASQDSVSTVALEACEFWCTYAEMTGAKSILRNYLSRLTPILLSNLIYSDEEISNLSIDEDTNVMPDREDDIKPFIHSSKSKGFHSHRSHQANGDLTGFHEGRTNDEDVEKEEEENSSEHSDDLDDDADPSEWNVRKCSAFSLDTLSRVFQDELLPYLLPHLQEKLLSEHWQVRESGILALGAIAEGCYNGLEPHLPALIPFLINASTDSHPMVRVMACWSLSRYIRWVVKDPSQRNMYLQPLLERLLDNVISRNKRVQAAACSALATIEEESESAIFPFLEPILKTLADAFPKYQEKNLRLLYDVIGTLAQTVGREFGRSEYIQIIMPCLIARWNHLSDDDTRLLPLLECLTAVFASLGQNGGPFAKPVFQRCIKIVHMALGKSERDENENGFVYFSLDLISSLIEGLRTSFENLSRDCNLLEVLHHCLKDSDPEIRQSAFAVVGELCKWHSSFLAPYSSPIVAIIEQNILLDHVSVTNNAVWSLGELCMNTSVDSQVLHSCVERVLPILIRLVHRPYLGPNLLENCAVTLGRLGLIAPQLLAPLLDQFSHAVCMILCKLPDEEEKEQALRGLCEMTKLNPNGIIPSFIPLCDMIVSCYQNSQLEKQLVEILHLFQSSSESNWNTFLNSLPVHLRNVLHHRFDISVTQNIGWNYQWNTNFWSTGGKEDEGSRRATFLDFLRESPRDHAAITLFTLEEGCEICSVFQAEYEKVALASRKAMQSRQTGQQTVQFYIVKLAKDQDTRKLIESLKIGFVPLLFVFQPELHSSWPKALPDESADLYLLKRDTLAAEAIAVFVRERTGLPLQLPRSFLERLAAPHLVVIFFAFLLSLVAASWKLVSGIHYSILHRRPWIRSRATGLSKYMIQGSWREQLASEGAIFSSLCFLLSLTVVLFSWLLQLYQKVSKSRQKWIVLLSYLTFGVSVFIVVTMKGMWDFKFPEIQIGGPIDIVILRKRENMDFLGPVEKEQCMLCFDDQQSPGGVNVCLSCLGCFCVDNNHSLLHYRKTGHQIGLNLIVVASDCSENLSAEKITKLAIGIEGGAPVEDKKEQLQITDTLVYLETGEILQEDLQWQYEDIRQKVKEAETESKNTFTSSWQLQLEVCEHTAFLEQSEDHKKIGAKSQTKCEHCDLASNLWLCLVCGHVGCGRQNFDGSGGNNHGLEHSMNSGHSVSVKLGSISASKGTADVHCYVCDEERLDPKLETHLEMLGIVLAEQQQTEATISEMELEQNLALDFTQSYEDGKALTPIYGPGKTGLVNLGNSCYLASVMQCLFATDVFRETFFRSAELHLVDKFYLLSTEPPSEDVCLQMFKLGYGLYSGKYGFVKKSDGDMQPKGIAPRMLKKAVARSHPEFSSMRQQDASEFLQFLLVTLQRCSLYYKRYIPDLLESFKFNMCQRLQCDSCKGVRYLEVSCSGLDVPLESAMKDTCSAQVTLEDCLEAAFREEWVEFDCPVCSETSSRRAKASKSNRIQTFPCILPITVRRFGIGEGWTPVKLRDNIDVPLEINLSNWKTAGQGCQPKEDEIALPSSKVNIELLNQLIQIGFPKETVERALTESSCSNLEDAVAWLTGSQKQDESPVGDSSLMNEQVEILVNMGFRAQDAKRALLQCDFSVERALDWLFSHPDMNEADEGSSQQMDERVSLSGTCWAPSSEETSYQLLGAVVHLGSSTSSGHYVAYTHAGSHWILFNDEKSSKTCSSCTRVVIAVRRYFFQM